MAEDWRLYNDDPVSGVKTYVRIEGTKVHVRKIADAEDMVAVNALSRQMQAGQNWGDGRVVARIPQHIYYKHLAEAVKGGDDKHVKRWLNDSDNRAWRSREGQV